MNDSIVIENPSNSPQASVPPVPSPAASTDKADAAAKTNEAPPEVAIKESGKKEPKGDAGNTIKNPFQVTKPGIAKSTAKKSKNELTQTTTSEIDLAACEFEDPKDYEDAKAQLGRIKPYMKQLKEHIGKNATAMPEKYALKLSDSLAKAGYKVDEEDGVFQVFSEKAKDAGLTQEQFNSLANFYIENEHGAKEQLLKDASEHVDNVLLGLGKNKEEGIERLRGITSQLSQFGLEESEIEILQDCISIDKQAILAVEKLLTRSYQSGNTQNSVAPSAKTLQERHNELMDKMVAENDPVMKGRHIEQLQTLMQTAKERGVALSLKGYQK